ncbi:hypothethical protein (plasmid) [Ralstonia solanacearum CMR15]|nr:hypothethical protein [Ralstonia solanacearum CMR15]
MEGQLTDAPHTSLCEALDAEAWCFGGEFGKLGRGGLLGAYCGGLYDSVVFASLLLAEALFLFCGGGRLDGGCLGEDVDWNRQRQETDGESRWQCFLLVFHISCMPMAKTRITNAPARYLGTPTH